MRHFALSLLLLGFSAAAAAADDPSSLLAKAGLAGKVEAHCSARFFATATRATALAVQGKDGKAAYYMLAEGKASLLAAYLPGAELQCLSPAQVAERNRNIADSGGILEGYIAPNGKLDVVCGFIDDTEAACWGYDPKRKTVVSRGGWIT
ncbi:hypothetical protein [Chitinolyticbacter albus]|uniref:hypothetical protein n=1 Tax=Chitinolyticbacter albus TaxID=2961951 RepID=UPI00210CD719|nr:hypothetical protein [Chitinolyticbacter albus]